MGDKQVINNAIYLALGVNVDGHKELLGMCLSKNEGAKFWLGILTELQNRGLKDILTACVDGLKGFPDATQTVYPQTCIVHMVRYSMKFIPWKDYNIVAADLKRIYQSATEKEALHELDNLDAKWVGQYPISHSWRQNWHNLNTLFTAKKVVYFAVQEVSKNGQCQFVTGV